MAVLTWDETGKRLYETGVDHGVLYLQNAGGLYDQGFAWNGLTTVTESPSGAEATALYADNIKYLNLISTEEFGGTIEAYTYPDEFAQCDGSAEPKPGVTVGQQTRKTFGLSYRTRIGNDIEGTELGYKIHLIYSATASPSEKAYASINDSPEAITFSWEISTTPVPVDGYKATASMTIDSTKVDATSLAALESALYGTSGQNARLPLPNEVIAMFAGTLTEVTPTQPAFDQPTNTITIPTVVGVGYYINGVVQTAGPVVITTNTLVVAHPNPGYTFPAVVDNDWLYTFA